MYIIKFLIDRKFLTMGLVVVIYGVAEWFSFYLINWEIVMIKKHFGTSKFPSLDQAKSFIKSKGYRYDSCYRLDAKALSYIYKNRYNKVAVIEKEYNIFNPEQPEFGNFYTVSF